MVAKNLPWAAEWEARAGYAGHLVRDLSNTHVMIVGGGTLIATGVCWYVLPRMVGRPLASNGLAQAAFWFTAAGLLGFYVALIANGIAIGRLVQHGWDYQAAKEHMGNWYRVPVGASAGVMGMGYWCFAANVALTIFQARLVRVPKPSAHLWKFLLTGAGGPHGRHGAGRDPGPAEERRLALRGQARGRVDRPDQPRAHQPRHRLDHAGRRRPLLPPAAARAAPRRPAQLVNRCFWLLLGGSLAFYATALYLGFHEGHLVVARWADARAGRGGHAAAPVPDHGRRGRDARGLLDAALARRPLGVEVAPARSRRSSWPGCGALAIGTFQGPVQAFPAVNELLDRSGDAGDVIVNLHAQLNMLGGLMPILLALALALMRRQSGEAWPRRQVRVAVVGIASGMGVYYAGRDRLRGCWPRTA